MSTPTASRPSSFAPAGVARPECAPGAASVGAASPRPDEPIVVRAAEDLVAAVPHLVGFVPEASLVVVAVKGGGQRSRLGLVARFDLPPADRRRRRVRDASPGWVAAAAGEAARVILRDDPEQVVALVFDEHAGGPLPWRRLVDRLEEDLRAADVSVLDLLLVDADRFWSYRCDDSDCCDREGRVVPTSSAVVAELTARGSAPLPSRASLRDLVGPADEARCAGVEAVARRELAAVGSWWADDDHPRWREWQRESVSLLRQVAARYADGGPCVSTEEAGRALAGMCDVTVRDVAVALLTGWGRTASDAEPRPQAGAGQPDGTGRLSRLDALMAELDEQPELDQLPRRSRDTALEEMWLGLSTSADGPLAVAPLTALGLHAWSRGNGALAGAVVDRALALDPAYRLAVLLQQALLVGLRPPTLDDDEAEHGVSPSEN